MDIFCTRNQLKYWRASVKGRVAYVPTMGALHDGHLSLVRLAAQQAEHVVVSIFVNPTQFAPHEDFDSYPRDVDADCALLEAEGVAAVYTPSRAEMYPDGESSSVKAGAAAQGLETDFRPHFFDGVVNVVARLFDHVQPDVAVFGEKDYQQLQVMREMVAAEGLRIEILGAPIARDEHGLALSSRNAYLSADELAIARKLNVVLREASASLRAEGEAIQSGVNDTGLPSATLSSQRTLGSTDGEALDPSGRWDDILEDARRKLLEAGFDKVDYVEQRWGRVLAAAWLGKTRLIDNCEIIKP